MGRRRDANRVLFLKEAERKHGDRFDYSRVDFVNQKTEVTIGCPDHEWFEMTPYNHLRSPGCSDCGIAERARIKQEAGRERFLKRFESKHGTRLVLLSEYLGATSPIDLKCLARGHRFTTTPDRLMQFFKEGCTTCANEARWEAQKKTSGEFIEQAKAKFPHFDFSDTSYQGAFELIEFSCPSHGLQSRAASDFLYSNYGCAVCGNEQSGYAGYRIQLLRSGDPSIRSRPTRIGLMTMSIWGIGTYKLGVTIRTLEQRYGEAVRAVYFEAVLDELDALLLERLLHWVHERDRDSRVKKKGMRDGARWSGDTELYFKRVITPMLSDLKHHVSELEARDPSYWDRYPELAVIGEEVREVTPARSKKKSPRPVICLDTDEIYPSASEAARAIGGSQGNLSMVCRGQRGRVKGLRFVYLDDYEEGAVPKFVPYEGTKKRVRCVDTDELFESINEAAASKGVSAAKITAVCRGRRKTCGGLGWEYADG